mgnify:FL=1
MKLRKREGGLYDFRWCAGDMPVRLTQTEVNELAQLFARSSDLFAELFKAERAYANCRLTEYYRHKSRLFREIRKLRKSFDSNSNL